jgi:uncharacterized protein (UPF0332 family)
MEPGERPIINFNEQIVGVMQFRADADTPLPIEKGQKLQLADLGEIVGMQLTTEYANAGHLTAIVQKGIWYLMFDFRYNSERIARSIEVARQFHSAAESAKKNGHLNAALENLFTAVEIAAKSYLMIHPDERLLEKHGHGFVASEFNRYGGKFGNVERKYVTLLNKLAELRGQARYGGQLLLIAESDMEGWLKTAEEMLADVTARRAAPYRDN